MIDVNELLKRGAYFGHKVSRTNPKSLSYVYKAENDIYLIDLFKTKECLEKAINYLATAKKNEETLLIVGTKRVIKNYLAELCEKNEIPYLTEKWIGGFFTNFSEIKKNIKRVNDWLQQTKSGQLDGMIKHERAKLDKKMRKLEKIYHGVLNLKEIPQNIIIIDIKKEKNALNESRRIKNQQILAGKPDLKIIGIADTNADPGEVDYPIVVNDDSFPSLEYVLNNLLAGYNK